MRLKGTFSRIDDKGRMKLAHTDQSRDQLQTVIGPGGKDEFTVQFRSRRDASDPYILDLLGHAVEVDVTITRRSFKSIYQANVGQTIECTILMLDNIKTQN